MTKFDNLLRLITTNSFQNINKLVFMGVAFVLLIIMCIISKDAGINIDEHFHVDHAENVWNYYKTLGKDKTALYNEKSLHLYGQSLDNFVHIFNETFSITDTYFTRHLFSSIVGWILILFAGLTATLLFGWQAGWITLLLIFFSPRILGHSFNNLKDIPFAASYMFTIYFILRMINKLPKVNYKTFIPIAIGIAWSISLRIGGIILILYLFLFFGSYYLIQKPFLSTQILSDATKNLKYLIGTCIIGYLLGLILWPYALSGPFNKPFNALSSMTNYAMHLNQLFEGQIIQSSEMPWYYGTKYIVISSPLIVGVGLLLFLFRLKQVKSNRLTNLSYFLLFFTFIFPLVYTIYKDSNLYSGWRHLLWIYSPLVVLASGGLSFLIQQKKKWIKYGTAVIFAALLIHPVAFTIKNHPYQYTYYNQLVGGIKGAYGKYETDSYYHTLKAGAKFLEENGYLNDTVIVMCNHARTVKDALGSNATNANIAYCRFYEKSRKNWDYAIWANTLINPKQLTEGFWPPKETIYTIDVDGMPIGAVVKRVSYDDYHGFNALQKGQWEKAKSLFKKHLKVYPENEEVLEGLALSFAKTNQLDSAIIYADKAIFYNPRQYGAYVQKARAYNQNKMYEEALTEINRAIEIENKIASVYFEKGTSLRYLERDTEAISNFQQALKLEQDYTNAYLQIADILINSKEYNQAIGTLNSLLKVKPDNVIALSKIAKCYLFQNKPKEAKEVLSKIPPSGMNNIEALKALIRFELYTGNITNARRALNYTKNIKSDSDLEVIRSIFAISQEDYEAGRLNAERALKLDRTNKEAKELIATIDVAISNPNSGSIQKSEQSIMFQKPKPKQTSPIKVPTK